jgi:monovalent cation:H+ antiporter-2, CPA2 family
MHHETVLIATIAMSFVLAFGFGFVAARLGLPPLIGYLVAGIAVGPFTPGFVADSTMAGELAEVGVILLMFGVGLHFSAADLMAVRWIAVPGAIVQIVLATALGDALSMAWGWSLGGALVFGLSLSVASTVVLLRTLEDRNAIDSPNGRIAVGWLIVEDLAMVVALVLLPAVAGLLGGSTDPHSHGAGGSLLVTLGLTLLKVAGFVALAMILGPRLAPWLLKQVARTGSRELFTLAVLALALGIAYGSAELFGVSFALGAFFAGVVLNESDFSHRAATESLPMQDAFAILFFVSVGMLLDPAIILREPLAVVAVVLVILLGKSVIAFLVVVLLGYPVATALTVSASLAQIGEFSFILAGLGKSLGLLPAEGLNLIVAGALLSIALNPVCFAAIDLLLRRVGAAPRLAAFGEQRLSRLQAELDALRERSGARAEERSLQVQNLVEQFPILAQLDHAAREELLLLFHPRTASPGERVIRKGDRPDAAYFITEGMVEVAVPGREVRLGLGDFFGEMALLSGERRVADVTAIDFCKFLTLKRRDFLSFVNRQPELRARLDEITARRTAETAESVGRAAE